MIDRFLKTKGKRKFTEEERKSIVGCCSMTCLRLLLACRPRGRTEVSLLLNRKPFKLCHPFPQLLFPLSQVITKPIGITNLIAFVRYLIITIGSVNIFTSSLLFKTYQHCFNQSRILTCKRYDAMFFKMFLQQAENNRRTQSNIRGHLSLVRGHEGSNTVGILAQPHTGAEAWPFQNSLCPRDTGKA